MEFSAFSNFIYLLFSTSFKIMVYPSTTHYLTRKLNWMARKLKFMNEASAIKEWTEAMHCVFKSLEAFSKNKDLSTPTQIGLKKMDIHRGENINVLSLHDGIKVTGKVVKKLKRPVMKGMRSVSSRSLMKSETGREMRIEQQSSRSFLEVPSRLV